MSDHCYDQISRHGLTQVYRPQKGCDKAVAHIIFVHGLFGHPEKTWTGVKAVSKVAQRGSVPPPPKTAQRSDAKENDDDNTDQRPSLESNSVFWPAALLPKIVPNTQIWTWGYDADIDGFRSSASQNTVSQHATNLLSDVADVLESKDCSLPLIFIVHSLGGLIVKAAMSMSCGAKANRFKIVVPVVRGILFLGTPHRGSSSASIGKVAYQVTKAVARRPNEKLLQALEKNSDTLDQINNGFLQTLEEHQNIAIASFREEKETRKYLFFSTTVVEADSARIGLAREELNSIPANHRNMAKLLSTEDVGFKRVSAQVRRWIQLLPMALDDKDKEGYSDCVRSLHSPITKARLKNIAPSHSETLQWLFDNDVVDFSSWLQDSRDSLGPIYWIQGKPGSGKSTLMKFAMMDPKLSNLLETSENIPYVITGFFFHDRGVMVQKSISGMLQELLHSILVKSSSLRQFIYPIYKTLVESQQTQLPVWDVESLQSAFKAIIEQRQVTTRLCLFLDALDEHRGDNEHLADLMKTLVALADGKVVKVKLCLASRPWDTFVTSFSKCPGFKVHNHTYNDIQAYTLSEFNRSSSTRPEVTAQKDVRLAKLAALAVQVTKKAHGVFIWVRIVVEEISKGLRDRTPYFVLEEKLAKMPEELKDLYQHTLERIEPDHVEESYVMLQIALCALSPLALETFVNTTSHVVWDRVPEHEEVEDMTQRIVSRSGGLLEVTELAPVETRIARDSEINEVDSLEQQIVTNETPSRESEESIDEQIQVVRQVQFIHQTVKEYIQSRTDNFGLNRTRSGGSGYLYILASAVFYIAEWADEIAFDLFEYARLAYQNKERVSQDKLYRILLEFSKLRLEWWLAKKNIEFYTRVFELKIDTRGRLAILALVAGLFEFVRGPLGDFGRYWHVGVAAVCVVLIGPKITSVQTSRREMLNLLFHLEIPLLGQIYFDSPLNQYLGFYGYTTPMMLILKTKGRFNQDETERVSAMAYLLDHGLNPNQAYAISSLNFTGSLFELCIRQENAEVVRLFGQYGGTLPPEMVLPMRAIWQMIYEPSAVLKEVMEIMERNYPEMMVDETPSTETYLMNDVFWDTRTSAAALMLGTITAIGTGMRSVFGGYSKIARLRKRAVTVPG